MGRLNELRPTGLRHFLRCRILLRIRRFLRPLYDVLCLVDDWPYFLLWRYRSKLCPRGTKPGRRSFLNETADSIRKSASGSRSWRSLGVSEGASSAFRDASLEPPGDPSVGPR